MLVNFLKTFLSYYASPVSLNAWWNYGFIVSSFIIIQIILGLLLVIHYTSHDLLAFLSITYLNIEILYGSTLYYFHAFYATVICFLLYTHLFSGIFFGLYTYPSQEVWLIGIILIFCIIAGAFVGYVLPWGQMSYWAATVITTLVASIPACGYEFMQLFWGDFSMSGIGISSAFDIHYLIAISVWEVIFVHILILHEYGSGNPYGLISSESVTLSPYFIINDTLFFLYWCYISSFFILGFNHIACLSENFVEANYLQTPAHITPEWYFWLFYAILSSVTDKLYGCILLIILFVILILMPRLFDEIKRSDSMYLCAQCFFWFYLGFCIVLTSYGGILFEYPYNVSSGISTVVYFSYYFVILFFLLILHLIIFLGFSFFIIIIENVYYSQIVDWSTKFINQVLNFLIIIENYNWWIIGFVVLIFLYVLLLWILDNWWIIILIFDEYIDILMYIIYWFAIIYIKYFWFLLLILICILLLLLYYLWNSF